MLPIRVILHPTDFSGRYVATPARATLQGAATA
jgi:hypothetical protein